MMIPYSPDDMNQVGDQITQALITAQASAPPNGTPRAKAPVSKQRMPQL